MRVSKIFGDHAVFQRNKPIRIWGEGAGIVSVSLNTQTVYTVCRNGRWNVSLSPMAAGGPYELVLKDDLGQCIFSEIYIGDVWLAAGQSNMEQITMLTYDGLEDAKKIGNNSQIRFFTVPRKTRKSDMRANWHFETVFPVEASWQICTPETALHFSAIGFRFAAYLQKDQNIPIGIISVNCGGTPIESWIEEELFFGDPQLEQLQLKYTDILRNLDLKAYTQIVDQHQKVIEERIKAVSITKAVKEMGIEKLARTLPFEWPEEPPMGPYHIRWPGVLFEYMIKTISPMALCGVLWYQGESNIHNWQYYFTLFSKLTTCWRKVFKDELPFFTVQIAPFGYAAAEGCPQLVGQQIKASNELDRVFFVTSNDIGEKDNIHPLHKKCISERLFLAAKNAVYGEKIEYCGPIFKKAVHWKANMVKVSFTHTGSGLYSKGEVANLYLKAQNGEYKPAQSKIEGHELIVWSPDIAFPTEIKMAFDNTDIITLYNLDGFVAAPFYSIINEFEVRK